MKATAAESIISVKNGSPEDDQGAQDAFLPLEEELKEGLRLYWDLAAHILEGSGIRLVGPAAGACSIEHNFFSTLFLYSYFRCGIRRERRVLYAAVNQCLRGMVTGCDNLLDDEYKVTLETDLPKTATRFRSVLDIMVSERVLFELLLSQSVRSQITFDEARESVRSSLHALTLSGAQEATEEAGIEGRRLRPDEVLTDVHHYKTGLLFQCPWAVPLVLEKPRPGMAGQVNDALYHIGIGCQLLDDMVDLVYDVKKRRHNFVASMIEWTEEKNGRRLLTELAASPSAEGLETALADFYREAYDTAVRYLEEGMEQLLVEAHRGVAHAAIDVIVKRIGADRLVPSGRRG